MNRAHLPSPRLMLLGFGILLLTSIAAGCSGGGGQSSSTQADFVKQGNAICTAASARIATAAQALPQGQAPTGPAAQTFLDTILAEGKAQVEAMRALKPPAELEADFTAFLTQFEAINDKVKSQGADAFFASQDDPYKALNPLAQKLGLTACSASE